MMMEESKQWEIEHYGDYVERWYIDSLPREKNGVKFYE